MKKLDSQQILHDLSWGGKAAISAVFFLIGLTLSLCSLYPLFVRFTQESVIIADNMLWRPFRAVLWPFPAVEDPAPCGAGPPRGV